MTENIQEEQKEDIINQYLAFINNEPFPCIAAKAALARDQIKCFVAEHMACPHDDAAILQFLYHFVDSYRNSTELFHSATVIFKGPDQPDEEQFDKLLWMRLQSLSNLDSSKFAYDHRVDSDPHDAKFSFSLKEEAFFVIGLHPSSSRIARRFNYPSLTFNPHAQFEKLREMHKFEKMQEVVRKRDEKATGSINPMLDDYGVVSEVFQYSGRNYSEEWQCPLKISNARSKNNPSA